MASPISSDNWQRVRQNFRSGFASNLHVAVATVDASGHPNITPIGSFFLNRDDFSGYYFEIFTKSIPTNAQTNPMVCIMAVNGNKWFWLKRLLFGKFASPPMIKLYGQLGDCRPATAFEIERGNRRLGMMKKLPGGKRLFGKMDRVREVRFHAFEVAKLPI